MSSSQAVSLAMEGFLVKGQSGAAIARMRDRYVMRKGGMKLDLPIEGTSYEHLLQVWSKFDQVSDAQAA
ncbi:MAG: hypothetical protein J0H67_06495 [Rhodospirillales bacterium]|nr:hypothetical protein [Rhodospirillales bacterium]MBN8897226.1 hypothetical protein [Rhodospirillales bacterium]